MTRKRWKKLMCALVTKLCIDYGIKITGEQYKFYRDRRFTDLHGVKSYAEAWELLDDLRKQVGMGVVK